MCPCKVDEPSLSEVVLGDETGTVTLRARGPQVRLDVVSEVCIGSSVHQYTPAILYKDT